jgi:hypothetical protein
MDNSLGTNYFLSILLLNSNFDGKLNLCEIDTN